MNDTDAAASGTAPPPGSSPGSSPTSPGSNWDEFGQLEVLTFEIGDECMAIEAVTIREILDLLPETRVPGASPLVTSVVNFRGAIIPIADLRIAFGMPVEPPSASPASLDSRIVVIETEIEGEQTQIGLRTDKVHEVTTLERGQAGAPPSLGMRWQRDYVRELVRQGEQVIVIPELTAIFQSTRTPQIPIGRLQ